ncbi:MAG: TIGR01212 family radical SAM protein [Bacteroidales bacterium]|nr:TIGR01212 family radical SAM protein [Bacteroidales bacterium]
MIYPWGDERRFNAYNRYLKNHFNGRIQKIALDAGFTCPNRDGSKGTGGCSFCLNAAFNPPYCNPQKSVTQQLDDGVRFHQNRNRSAAQYLAYFQAYSNTYGAFRHLKSLYDEALKHPTIRGLIIATRPDCLEDETLSYLEELQSKTYIALEIGIESCRDKTLQRIHRGHDMACTLDAIQRAAQHQLHIGTHLIFGLPGETPGDWLEDLNLLNQLPIQSIKFHQLQIIKGTQMEQEFLKYPNDFAKMDLDTYVDFMVNYIGHLAPHIAIERFASEVPSRYLAAPGWGGVAYDQVLQRIENRLAAEDIWQGKRYAAAANTP